jgi:hypothetical protein
MVAWPAPSAGAESRHGNTGDLGPAETSTADRSQWTYPLDRLTSDHEGELVVVEVLDSEFGDNEQAARVPFGYATYDHRDDAAIIGSGSRCGSLPRGTAAHDLAAGRRWPGWLSVTPSSGGRGVRISQNVA